MKVEYTIKTNAYYDKDKIVEGLVNSGYIVSANLVKEKTFGGESYWAINIYKAE